MLPLKSRRIPINFKGDDFLLEHFNDVIFLEADALILQGDAHFGFGFGFIDELIFALQRFHRALINDIGSTDDSEGGIPKIKCKLIQSYGSNHVLVENAPIDQGPRNGLLLPTL